jgi:hypothetical protein
MSLRGQPVKTTIESFDITAAAWQLGIPTRLALTLDTLNLGIDTADPDFKVLSEAGITSLDLSGGVSVGWDPGLRALLGEASAASSTLGTVRLKISMGNAGPELFDIEPLMQQVGLLSLTATGVDVEYVDAGLVRTAFESEAKRQGRSVVALKQELITLIQVQMPSLVGNSEKARLLANSLARFIANPTTLSVQARAPSGIGASDMAQPEKIIDKIELSISQR